MSNVKTINVNSLQPDTVYFVRGKVLFSRIARQTTDEERDEWNKSRRFKIGKNYTTLRISEASVIARDPSNPTDAEIYASEHLYNTSSPDVINPCFTAINKSPSLPSVFVRNNVTGSYDPVTLDAELAAGLDVTIAMRVFGTSGNNGVTMAQVYVNEDLRLFDSARSSTVVTDAATAALGITFSAPAPAVSAQPETAQPAASADDPTDLVSEPATTANPFSSPQQTQPQNPPQNHDSNPFSAGGGTPFSAGRKY